MVEDGECSLVNRQQQAMFHHHSANWYSLIDLLYILLLFQSYLNVLLYCRHLLRTLALYITKNYPRQPFLSSALVLFCFILIIEFDIYLLRQCYTLAPIFKNYHFPWCCFFTVHFQKCLCLCFRTLMFESNLDSKKVA